MNILTLKSERKLIKGNFEKIYERENKITSIRLNLPAKVGNYNTNECNIELRAYIGENDYIGYEVDTSSIVADVPITTDITEKAQTVNFMCYITHSGNVIGKTNLVSVEVLEAPEEKEPLTPREQFDTVIAEQRQTIKNQAETISEQSTEITEKTEQIAELNGQVTELENENAEQAETITRQNTTIDELNRRVPPLQTLDPINPSQVQKTYNPESPNIGFPQVIVNAPTAEGLNFDFGDLREGKEFLGGVGTYNPFPEHSVGGIYITDVDEDGYPKKILVKNYEHSASDFPGFFDTSIYGKKALKEVVFENCPSINQLPPFDGFGYLEKVIFPSNLVALRNYAFRNCQSLRGISDIPSSVTSIGIGAFYGTKLQTLRLPDNIARLEMQSLAHTPLKTINFPKSLKYIGNYAFDQCNDLEFITIENGFNCNNLDLSTSTLYSAETIVSWLEALADRTGETAYTLTIGTTNINKLTAEQRAIATNKNWNLA